MQEHLDSPFINCLPTHKKEQQNADRRIEWQTRMRATPNILYIAELVRNVLSWIRSGMVYNSHGFRLELLAKRSDEQRNTEL
jgi:hypothetical protein